MPNPQSIRDRMGLVNIRPAELVTFQPPLTHNRLDKHAMTYGPTHHEDDEWHSHTGVRSMIDNMINSLGNISKERATDYVRIAHGHECLDYMASKLRRQYDCSYASLDWDEVFRRTWRYMKSKGYDRAYYRELG
jgi:hypothetical protein